MESHPGAYNPFMVSLPCPKCQTQLYPFQVTAFQARNLYAYSCQCGALILVAVAGKIELLSLDNPQSAGEMVGLCLTENKSQIAVAKGFLKPVKGEQRQ